jgi:hypothetical protein
LSGDSNENEKTTWFFVMLVAACLIATKVVVHFPNATSHFARSSARSDTSSRTP